MAVLLQKPEKFSGVSRVTQNFTLTLDDLQLTSKGLKLSKKNFAKIENFYEFYEDGWNLKVNWFNEQHHLVGLSNFGTP